MKFGTYFILRGLIFGGNFVLVIRGLIFKGAYILGGAYIRDFTVYEKVYLELGKGLQCIQSVG